MLLLWKYLAERKGAVSLSYTCSLIRFEGPVVQVQQWGLRLVSLELLEVWQAGQMAQAVHM